MEYFTLQRVFLSQWSGVWQTRGLVCGYDYLLLLGAFLLAYGLFLTGPGLWGYVNLQG